MVQECARAQSFRALSEELLNGSRLRFSETEPKPDNSRMSMTLVTASFLPYRILLQGISITCSLTNLFQCSTWQLSSQKSTAQRLSTNLQSLRNHPRHISAPRKPSGNSDGGNLLVSGRVCEALLRRGSQHRGANNPDSQSNSRAQGWASKPG